MLQFVRMFGVYAIHLSVLSFLLYRIILYLYSLFSKRVLVSFLNSVYCNVCMYKFTE